jgi:hypothetical protein
VESLPRDAFVFALAVLACYRLAILIARDDGPGDILLAIRAKLGAYNYGDDGRPDMSIGRLVSCEHCIGVWVSLLLAICLWPISFMTPVYGLAIAGGQSFLESVTPGDNDDSGQGNQAG